ASGMVGRWHEFDLYDLDNPGKFYRVFGLVVGYVLPTSIRPLELLIDCQDGPDRDFYGKSGEIFADTVAQLREVSKPDGFSWPKAIAGALPRRCLRACPFSAGTLPAYVLRGTRPQPCLAACGGWLRVFCFSGAAQGLPAP